MPGIYDMARALDQRGVVAPAEQAATGIRLGRSQAKISEQKTKEFMDQAGDRLSDYTKNREREQVAYEQGQQAYKYSQAMRHVKSSLSVPQSPKAYLESIERLLKEEKIPEEMYAIFEGIRAEIPDLMGEPAKMQELRGDVDNMLGGFVNELGKMQIEGRQKVATTAAEGRQEVAETAAESREAVAKTSAKSRKEVGAARNATAERISAANNASREAAAETKSQETGVSPKELSKLYADADKALRDEFVDPETKTWAVDSGFWKETTKERRFLWDTKVTNFDFEKYEQLREEKVQKMLGGNELIEVDY